MTKPVHPPLVSVVIPAWNAAGTILEVLTSVRRQTFADYEIIVVDDASRDDTATVVDAWTKQAANAFPASNCRTIRLPSNRGPAGARNVGIAAARGTWIAFLDGDDAWLPTRLAVQMDALREAPQAALVCGDIVIMGTEAAGGGQASGAGARVRRIGLEEFIDENPVPTSTVLARRDAILKAGGFDERFRGPEDIDLWMRLAAQGDLLKICAPLSLYRERPGSLSMNQQEFLPNILAVYEKAFAPGGALYAHRQWRRRAVAGRYVSAAWSYRVCGRRGRAAALILRSWLLWPYRLKIEQRHPAWRLRMLASLLRGGGMS